MMLVVTPGIKPADPKFHDHQWPFFSVKSSKFFKVFLDVGAAVDRRQSQVFDTAVF